MENLISAIFSTDFVFSILRLTTPILLAALAALITDRAGVMNIGLEGSMCYTNWNNNGFNNGLFFIKFKNRYYFNWDSHKSLSLWRNYIFTIFSS